MSYSKIINIMFTFIKTLEVICSLNILEYALRFVQHVLKCSFVFIEAFVKSYNLRAVLKLIQHMFCLNIEFHW